jgi:2-amino-4-hydroxy-6-hydroxymethyldihydropteridine diphosphokinase
MHRFTISLGSNIPEGELKLAKAIEWLATVFTLIESTPTYSTPDVKDASAPCYTNAIAIISTELSPIQLNTMLKNYETDNGRIRQSETKAVAIDLDLVVCDETILRPRDYSAPYFRQGLPLLATPL